MTTQDKMQIPKFRNENSVKPQVFGKASMLGEPEQRGGDQNGYDAKETTHLSEFKPQGI